MTRPLLHQPVLRRRPGSEADLGPFLNVLTWILLITSGLAVLTRLVTKRALRRRIDVDDGFVVAALVTSIGSGVAVGIQTANGLGRDVGGLADTQIVAYAKSEYANRLLYIATLALAKVSILSLLMILTAADLHRRLGIVLTVVIAVWGIASVFVAAFQCGFDEPWRFFGAGSSCFSMVAFWRAMGAINMLTDAALILFPVHVIVTLQMSTGKKLTILIFFGTRLLDIIATAIQLSYTPAFASLNPTRDLWKWTLTTQIVECITILTSCVPYLRPLLEAIPSGLYGADEMRRRGTASSIGYESYKLSTQSTTSEPKTTRSRRSQGENGIRRFMPTLSMGSPTTHSNSASGLPGGPRRPDGETGVVITAPASSSAKEKGNWETDSIGSQTKIMRTTVVSAAWEEAQRRSSEASLDEIAISKT